MNNLTQFYLNFLKYSAKIQLAKFHPTVIGITGSAGKSSAVLATYLVLADKFHELVSYTEKGNSETGIPFEILKIPVKSYQGWHWLQPIGLSLWRLLTYWPTYKYLVAELGIDSEKSPKNMSHHLEIVQPEVGVFLNVSSVHGENYRGTDVIQSIANEKRKLLLALPKNGLAVYSGDHSQITHNNPQIVAEQKTFSSKLNGKADLQLISYQVNLTGTSYEFRSEGHHYQLTLPKQLQSQAAFGSFAAALLVGLRFGISIEQGIKSLNRHMSLPPGRMSLFDGMKKTHLVDSSYNSSPESTESALKMLSQIPNVGRKIAILGDMRELGRDEAAAHLRLAEIAAKQVDIVIWVGPLTQKYCYDYLRQHSPKTTQLVFETAWEAIEPAKALLKENDLILIKGSQNTIFLEIVVEALLDDPKSDRDKLCRREPYWETQRLKLRK